MKRLTLPLLLVFAVAAFLPARAESPAPAPPPAPANPAPAPAFSFPLDASLTVGETTIRYPRELEAQAKTLAAVWEKVVPSRRDALRRPNANQEKVAARIVELLGCPEHGEIVREVMSDTCFMTGVFLDMTRDVRLYREADLRAAGGLHEGPINLIYVPATDKFQLSFQATSTTYPAASGRAFFPGVVRADGTLGSRTDPPEKWVADFFAQDPAMITVGAHEAAESVLTLELHLLHPFARWFNEGVGNWVALQITREFLPESNDRAAFLPTAESAKLRDQINLLTWAQNYCAKPVGSEAEDALSSAHYRYAAELITRLLAGSPPGTLETILQKLAESPAPDSETICETFREVTGKDARRLLMEYTPPSVREGITAGAPYALRQAATKAIESGDSSQAVKLLSELLTMTPADPDAQVDLAVALRRTKAPRMESEGHLWIAAALAEMQTHAPPEAAGPQDADVWYALGRVAQYRGDKAEAGRWFKRLPETDLEGLEVLRELGLPIRMTQSSQ